jgi:hypothetical protein
MACSEVKTILDSTMNIVGFGEGDLLVEVFKLRINTHALLIITTTSREI